MMNEEEMVEDEMAGSEEQPAVDPTTQIPPEIEQQIIKGATALFHTSVQVIAAESMQQILKRNLQTGRLAEATWIVTMECVKIHARQKLPVNPPMIMASVPYIASFLKSMANKMGAKVDERHVNKAVLETIDKVIGRYEGSKTLAQHKEQAASMKQQQASAPPDGGMGAAPPAPAQGGMM